MIGIDSPFSWVGSEPVRKQIAMGSETILLVDCEDGVRKPAHAVLKNNGYEVLEASNAATALETNEKNAHKIDMVLTDGQVSSWAASCAPAPPP